jgi:hypothetical protein
LLHFFLFGVIFLLMFFTLVFFFMLMLHASAQGVLFHIDVSHWCWWFSIFTMWLWVLFFKFVCCKPQLLGTSSPFFFCHIKNILVVATCMCHVLFYFLGRLLVVMVASFWPSLWLWSSSCVFGCVLLGHHCGHGRPLFVLNCFLLTIALVTVILLCS